MCKAPVMNSNYEETMSTDSSLGIKLMKMLIYSSELNFPSLTMSKKALQIKVLVNKSLTLCKFCLKNAIESESKIILMKDSS